MTLTETNRITGLAFTPDGLEVAATSIVGTVEVCSVRGKEQTMWKAHKGDFYAAFLPGGKTLVTAGTDATLRLWDVTTRREIRRLGRTSNAFCSLAITPDGTRIAAGINGRLKGVIRFYDPYTGYELASLTGHNDGVKDLAFIPDGRMLVSVATEGMRVWRAPSLAEAESDNVDPGASLGPRRERP